MTLSPGVRLGPYEIRGRLGAGGMGEVYLAWDERLGREVAVKVLPSATASDPDRRRRFEQEAKAAGALHHSNLLAVYDVGSHEGAPYIVSERLEGETLRGRMDAPDLTPRRAVEYAVQVARGLAAAHERGIVHRDLKPENLFVCRDGTVKILDFGLAKLRDEAAGGPEDETAARLTRPGAVVGTTAYMSPEQVRGLPVDERSDVFSLGVVLYEMLARRRPFGGDTPAEVQAAILREEPRELPAVDARVPVALDRVVRRCLEKRPEDRFDTARDVALSLEAVAGGSGQSPDAARPAGGRRRLRSGVALAAALLAATAIGAALAWHLRPPPAPPSYTQLTYRRGTILGARFAPDGATVVYSAAWDGQPARVFTTSPGSRESRDLGIEGRLLAVSSNGEMAVELGRHHGASGSGTLATVSLSGGAPREVLGDVRDADWDAEGRELAVIHVVGGGTRLEYPIGHVLYEPAGGLVRLRMLPSGTIAVFERVPDGGTKPFTVSLIDRQGGRKVLSGGWADWAPLSWSSASGEIFFPGSSGGEFALQAVSPTGRTRLVARVPGDFLLHDVDRHGRILLDRTFPRGGILALPPGETQERDLSWLDFSSAADLSADGRQLLIGEIGGGLGGRSGISLRKTDGSPAVMLAEGSPLALSPDGSFVLALPVALGAGDHLLVIPTGAGARREIRHASVPRFTDARWFPDGRHVVVVGGQDERLTRLYYWDVENAAAPRALSPEGDFGSPAVAPDGRWVAAAPRGAPLALYPVDGGSPRPLPGSQADDEPLRFSTDGRWLFVRGRDRMPARVERIDVVSGARHPWKELRPADPAGVFNISSVVVTPDGKSYAYTFSSAIGSLYLVEGLK
jgi:eukaryotic-like serine/threonine-protein kinase